MPQKVAPTDTITSSANARKMRLILPWTLSNLFKQASLFGYYNLSLPQNPHIFLDYGRI
jgi:hypothetical protein